MTQYAGLLKLSRWSLQRTSTPFPQTVPDESCVNLVIPLADFAPRPLTQSIGSSVATMRAMMKATAGGQAVVIGQR